MSAIVSLPPRLLDQSFPRDAHDLSTVGQALGELTDMAQKNEAFILVSDAFQLIVEDFNWAGPNTGIKCIIHQHLSQLFLSGQNFIVEVDLAPFRNGNKHPLPKDVGAGQAAIDLWQEETGSALRWHDQASGNDYYIGIACPNAFAGGEVGDYPDGTNGRRFPIVGPHNLKGPNALVRPAFAYTLPAGIQVPQVNFRQAKRNLHLLGAREVVTPNGGSHYRVTFPGSRSWVIDPNVDPLPQGYLTQLEAITGYDYPVICYVLARGEFPPKKRFDENP